MRPRLFSDRQVGVIGGFCEGRSGRDYWHVLREIVLHGIRERGCCGNLSSVLVLAHIITAEDGLDDVCLTSGDATRILKSEWSNAFLQTLLRLM